MTTTAPNLGKLFTSCTKRPATAEDIALLAPGDWISERECSWSWQFKNSCQDMAVGVWEGKEFFVPHHLLMVCEIIEGQVLEKFFKKSEPKFKVGDRAEFKVGDRVVSKHPLCLGQVFEIAKYPNVYANGSVSYESLVTTTDLVLGTDQVSLVENNQGIKVGDRFAVYPGVSNECEIMAFVGDKYRVRWSLKGDEMEVDAAFLAELKSVQPDLDPEKFFMNESDDSASGSDEGASGECWNPEHFGLTPHEIEASGQATIFYDASIEPPDPDDFAAIEEYEEAWKQWENLQQGYCLPVAEDALKVQLPQDTDQCGRSNATPTPQPSTENDSPQPNSLSKTLPLSPTNLSVYSQPQTLLSAEVLARIFPLQAIAPDLKEIAQACFLSSSDSFKSSSLRLYFGKTLVQCYLVEGGKISSKSLMRLQRWGIWGLGKLGTETATFPKTESDYSAWVFTGDIRATLPRMGKKSLQEIFNGVNSVSGEQIDEAYTLKASTPKLGVGNKSQTLEDSLTQRLPNTFVSIPVKVYVDGVAEATESPALCTSGWQHRSPLHRDKRGASFAVLYRAAGGDRLYHEEAPTLRSLSNPGNHQSGSGAYKIREYQGETYFERPINATEAEQLMGWEVGSTAIGINKEGDEVTISQTQRIKILGNGIVPGEITDILIAIKPILERRLESEVPDNMRFAYRQLCQKGISHQEALKLLSS